MKAITLNILLLSVVTEFVIFVLVTIIIAINKKLRNVYKLYLKCICDKLYVGINILNTF